MRRFRIIIVLVFFFYPFFIHASNHNFVIPKSIVEQLNSIVREEIGDDQCANEYLEARKFFIGDVDKDGRKDILVLFTLEGFACGNGYSFYMAVFRNEGKRFSLAAYEIVRGKGYRSVSFNSVKNGVIILDTKEYGTSMKSKAKYILDDDALMEVTDQEIFWPPKNVNNILKDLVQKQVAKTQCGKEYRPDRRYFIGDVDNDGRNDILVLYIINRSECGQIFGLSYHLAVFRNTGNDYSFAANAIVGEAGKRFVFFKSVENGRILLRTLEYSQSDPRCCPTKSSWTQYILDKGELIELSK